MRFWRLAECPCFCPMAPPQKVEDTDVPGYYSAMNPNRSAVRTPSLADGVRVRRFIAFEKVARRKALQLSNRDHP